MTFHAVCLVVLLQCLLGGSGTSCTVSVEPGLPSTGMVLELACLAFAGGRGTSVVGGNGGRGCCSYFRMDSSVGIPD